MTKRMRGLRSRVETPGFIREGDVTRRTWPCSLPLDLQLCPLAPRNLSTTLPHENRPTYGIPFPPGRGITMQNVIGLSLSNTAEVAPRGTAGPARKKEEEEKKKKKGY